MERRNDDYRVFFSTLDGARIENPECYADTLRKGVGKNFWPLTWVYNPWTGQPRSESEIEDDRLGEKIVPPAGTPRRPPSTMRGWISRWVADARSDVT